MIEKNDEFIVDITDQDDMGNGIGKADGFPLFVRHAVVGDRVRAGVTRVKKNFAYARIVSLIIPSKLRAEPECGVFRRCGGCQLQLMSYEAQLDFKRKRVLECLRRIGGCPDIRVEPVIPSEKVFRYRNKAQYPVGIDREGNPTCGFFAERTHDIIPHEDCLLSPRIFSVIKDIVIKWMRRYDIPAYSEKEHRGLIRHIFLRTGISGRICICLVINGANLPYSKDLLEMLSEKADISGLLISTNKNKGNVIMGSAVKCLFGEPYTEDFIGEIRFRISPLSFYQINTVQTVKLYDKALEFAALKGDETVLDLYCGIGTIALYAAKKAGQVIGIEIVPDAVRDAVENARLNGIENARFYCGKAEEVLPSLFESGMDSADVVIVDPPRKGCDERTLDTIAGISPSRFIYVSCDPATLARDIKYMKRYGYEPVKVQPVDMFPQSVHIECIVCIQKAT